MGATRFVNRVDELERLTRWWDDAGADLALVWGRRRVGKTALIQHFAETRRAIFHTGADRPRTDELALLSRAARDAGLRDGFRDFRANPFRDWDEAFDVLGRLTADEPLLLVLDEFTELTGRSPELPGVLRAFWDRARGHTRLKIVISGSAVRTLTSMITEREPLFGRFSTIIRVEPFRPHEAAMMLPSLSPEDRALVWGLVGGTPLYLSWWDESAPVRSNVERLLATPDARLLQEGRLLLTTEGEATGIAGPVMRAIGAGRTKYGEIQDAIGTQPARTLDALAELRLIERRLPVTDAGRSKRVRYAIADNFLRFWLTVLDPHIGAIERGLGGPVVDVILSALDDHMGPAWEAAFREHLTLLAVRGRLTRPAVAIGPWWSADGTIEIDAVALAGRERVPFLAGEAKWARSADGGRLLAKLARNAAVLPGHASEMQYALCARREVTGAPEGTIVITADDIFGL